MSGRFRTDPSLIAGSLYDAAMEPRLWPQALDRVGDALGGAALVVSLTRGGHQAFGATHRLDPERERVLRERYGRPETNPLFAAMPRLPVLAPVERDALITEREYLASSLFNDVFRPQGLLHTAVSCLARDNGVLIANGVLRRAGAAFDAEHERLYAAILPHLRRAVELTVRLSDAELVRRRVAAAADAHPDRLVIVDERRRILFANAAAEHILARGDGLCRRRGLLDAQDPVHGRILARLVQDAALCKDLRGGCIRIGCSNGALPLAVIVTPLPEDLRGAANPGAAAALVSVIDLAARPAPLAPHLTKLFDLSKAEIALALALFEGKRPEDIALERGVRISTIRSQLRSILAKTGTHRQSELMRLLARLTAGCNRS